MHTQTPGGEPPEAGLLPTLEQFFTFIYLKFEIFNTIFFRTWRVICLVLECWCPKFTISGRSTCANASAGGVVKRRGDYYCIIINVTHNFYFTVFLLFALQPLFADQVRVYHAFSPVRDLDMYKTFLRIIYYSRRMPYCCGVVWCLAPFKGTRRTVHKIPVG